MSFLHPIGVLDDDTPLIRPPHMAAPALSPTFLLPEEFPPHAQYSARKPYPPPTKTQESGLTVLLQA